MLRSLIRSCTSLRLRNDVRLRLRRHPIVLRSRYPALEAVPLRRNAVVFDGGAHVGYFSECVLAYQPWALLHVFEPIPEAFASLEKTLAPYGGVIFNRVALGARREEREFRVSRFQEASSFLENGEELRSGVYGIDFSVDQIIRVPVETIAGYVRDHDIDRVDLLKLDVQGFELEVLKGSEPVLDRIDFVYCEAQFRELYQDAPLVTDLFEWLHRRGFELLRMSEFRADDEGRLMECDMLFQRNATR